ncbi:MAG TPA: hypothetical protein VJ350_04990 [Methanoregula sp.]|nr:hypothetical protein [Methanoregula sp.]
MPNFDGIGPLKRGRVIGHGLRPCCQRETGGERQSCDAELKVQKENRAD